MEIFQALASADGFQTLTSHILPKETTEPALFLVTLGPKVPRWLRSLVTFLLDRIGENVMARLVRVSRKKDMAQVYAWQHKRNVYTEKVRKLLWETERLDAVICTFSEQLHYLVADAHSAQVRFRRDLPSLTVPQKDSRP